MRHLGGNVFEGCRSLKEVRMSTHVEQIGEDVFRSCHSTCTVIVPYPCPSEMLEMLQKRAGAVALEIPEETQEIPAGEFDEEKNLSALRVVKTNATYSSQEGVLFNADKTNLIRYPRGKKKSKYVVPAGVVAIGGGNGFEGHGFRGCTSLTGVQLPDSLQSIGSYAFAGCSSLTMIRIPDGVTYIGKSAFAGCIGLTSLQLPDSVEVIDDEAFSGCVNLTMVQIPDSVKRVGENAFGSCTGLISTRVPSGLQEIGRGVFAGCDNLHRAIVPYPRKVLNLELLHSCRELTDMMVSENSHEHSAKNGVLFNKEQTELVFYPMGKKEGAYLMSEGVREIASQAFYGCEHLKHVVFADSMEKIAPDAFVNCPNLDEATRETLESFGCTVKTEEA